MSSELPSWPGASAVYSYLYRALEMMGAAAWQSAVADAQKRGRRARPFVPEAMRLIVEALGAGDEETLKAIQMAHRMAQQKHTARS